MINLFPASRFNSVIFSLFPKTSPFSYNNPHAVLQVILYSSQSSFSESIKIAEVYLESKDLDQTFSITIANNLPLSRTLSRSKRMTREIILRLINLTEEQVIFLIKGSLGEQRLLLL
jgi:hypothetical protein